MSHIRSSRRGFATLLVILIVALSAVILTELQNAALDDALGGRVALARVRATWAARAGVEAMIARLEYNAENPLDVDAFRDLDDMSKVAEGKLPGGTAGALYRVSTWVDGKEMLGPADAHAKININIASRETLALIPLMTEDVTDAILDWIDEDDDVTLLGAESSYYQSLAYPYEPRNAPMRSMQEFELIAGAQPLVVRNEDWNLNGLLDPNENDGSDSWPPDNADGKLDEGWAGIFTASSMDELLAPSGEAKLALKSAQANDIVARIGCTSDQAQAIVDYVAATEDAVMGNFIRTDLPQLQQQAGGQPPRPEALTREQLVKLLDECVIEAPERQGPGRLNINTAPVTVLEYIPGLDTGLADTIIGERAARPKGFASVVELLDVPGMSRRMVAELEPLLTTRSQTYVVTSRGRDAATGLEVEIDAVLDRSSIPVIIQELRTR